MDLKAQLAARAAARGGAGAPQPAGEEVVRRRPLQRQAGTEDSPQAASGQLYTWGRNDYGRCGVGDTAHRAAPTVVPDLRRVVKVRGGAGHTLAVTADGDAIAFGKNYLGQLGVGDDEDRYYAHKLQLEDKATSCSGGGNWSAVVTQSGSVFTMGCGYFHATGQTTESHLNLPTQVPFHLKVVDVACGELHGIVLTEQGLCFAWGRNTASADKVRGLEGKRVTAISSRFNWNMVIATNDNGEKEGQVWAWGENASGQLATPSPTGDESFSALPTQIGGGLEARRVVAISCGNDHGVAVDDGGDVWTWGVGELGQLGLGEECGLAVQAPQRIPYFSERKSSLVVVDVAAAKKHTLYLTRDGQVYVSGDDQFGNEKMNTPVNPRQRPSLLLVPFHVRAIGVGGYHSSIVAV